MFTFKQFLGHNNCYLNNINLFNLLNTFITARNLILIFTSPRNAEGSGKSKL